MSNAPIELDKATSILAAAIRETTEWIRYNAATLAVECDSELSAAVEEYNKLADRDEESEFGESDLSDEEENRLEELEEILDASPLVKEQEDAAEDLQALFRQINEDLSQEINIDFAQNALPECDCCE